MHISTKCSVAVHCLIFIYEYGNVKKVTSELLSLSTGNNSVTIRRILSALTLNAPLHEITLYRICKAIEPDFLSKLIGIHAFPSPLCPVGKNIHKVLDLSYQKIQNDLCRSLQSITMEDIMTFYHNI